MNDKVCAKNTQLSNIIILTSSLFSPEGVYHLPLFPTFGGVRGPHKPQSSAVS